MKLSIEAYEIVTQLLIAEINDAKQNDRKDDETQAREALQEIDAIGIESHCPRCIEDYTDEDGNEQKGTKEPSV